MSPVQFKINFVKFLYSMKMKLSIIKIRLFREIFTKNEFGNSGSVRRRSYEDIVWHIFDSFLLFSGTGHPLDNSFANVACFYTNDRKLRFKPDRVFFFFNRTNQL